jgi:hypothetical protein
VPLGLVEREQAVDRLDAIPMVADLATDLAAEIFGPKSKTMTAVRAYDPLRLRPITLGRVAERKQAVDRLDAIPMVADLATELAAEIFGPKSMTMTAVRAYDPLRLGPITLGRIRGRDRVGGKMEVTIAMGAGEPPPDVLGQDPKVVASTVGADDPEVSSHGELCSLRIGSRGGLMVACRSALMMH